MMMKMMGECQSLTSSVCPALSYGSLSPGVFNLSSMDPGSACLQRNSVGVGLLLSALETSVIATGLVSISSSLGRYDKANWVVTAYLITYTGVPNSTVLLEMSGSLMFDLWCGVQASSSSLRD